MPEKQTRVSRLARQISLNPDRQKRTGPEPLPPGEKREHCVSVRLNDAELKQLDDRRLKLKRGEWLRMAALDQLPPQIPAINQTAWAELSRSASNLNQVAKKLNGGESVALADVSAMLTELRLALLGAAL